MCKDCKSCWMSKMDKWVVSKMHKISATTHNGTKVNIVSTPLVLWTFISWAEHLYCNIQPIVLRNQGLKSIGNTGTAFPGRQTFGRKERAFPLYLFLSFPHFFSTQRLWFVSADLWRLYKIKGKHAWNFVTTFCILFHWK